jgi:hypothetical protein
LLERHAAEGDDFLLNIVIGDASWSHHFDPERKRQSMEWHNAASPKKKKARSITSAGQIIGTLSWDVEGCILVDFLTERKLSMTFATFRRSRNSTCSS